MSQPVFEIAERAVRLVAAGTELQVRPEPGVRSRSFLAGAALRRLGRLLSSCLLVDDPTAGDVLAAAVLETWIGGHGALLLADDELDLLERRAEVLDALCGSGLAARCDPAPVDLEAISLAALARRLDLAMYGTAEPPKAFQRHLRSFYDEIDVRGTAGPTSKEDRVRVCLWVTLFLAHDHFAANGQREEAAGARALFDDLRRVTDDLYRRRRVAGDGPTA